MGLDAIDQELEEIRARDPEGLLRPEAVVEYASDSASALHGKFTWDDDDAAQQWRLEEARQIIRVRLTRVAGVETRAFVSLSTDRTGGGGYRKIGQVLSQDNLRQQLVEQAAKDLRLFLERYRSVRKVAGLGDVLDRAEAFIAEMETQAAAA